jgi:hypothetical protein
MKRCGGIVIGFVIVILILTGCPVSFEEEQQEPNDQEEQPTSGTRDLIAFFLNGNFKPVTEDCGITAFMLDNADSSGAMITTTDSDEGSKVSFFMPDTNTGILFNFKGDFPDWISVVQGEDRIATVFLSPYNKDLESFTADFWIDGASEISESLILNKELFNAYADDPALTASENARNKSVVIATALLAGFDSSADTESEERSANDTLLLDLPWIGMMGPFTRTWVQQVVVPAMKSMRPLLYGVYENRISKTGNLFKTGKALNDKVLRPGLGRPVTGPFLSTNLVIYGSLQALLSWMEHIVDFFIGYTERFPGKATLSEVYGNDHTVLLKDTSVQNAFAYLNGNADQGISYMIEIVEDEYLPRENFHFDKPVKILLSGKNGERTLGVRSMSDTGFIVSGLQITLEVAGYLVPLGKPLVLLTRKIPSSTPLITKIFPQKYIQSFIEHGKQFYKLIVSHGEEGKNWFADGLVAKGVEWVLQEVVDMTTEEGSLFAIGRDITLELQDNITLKGIENNKNPLVFVGEGATFVMNNRTKITGNTVVQSDRRGSGVLVHGTFIMNGGEISHNTTVISTDYRDTGFNTGGGVEVFDKAVFKMSGGTISDNRTNGGGGVHVTGTFEMSGGTISGNTADMGGGIYIENNGELVISDSSHITGNTANFGGGLYINGTVTMSGGTITNDTANGGGGVCILSEGTFKMSGGAISSNIAKHEGGGVCNYSGTFDMSGGAITGNTADSGGGLLNKGTVTMSGGTITGNTSPLYSLDQDALFIKYHGSIDCMLCPADGKCSTCEGRGYVVVYNEEEKKSYREDCDACKGTGHCRNCNRLGTY